MTTIAEVKATAKEYGVKAAWDSSVQEWMLGEGVLCTFESDHDAAIGTIISMGVSHKKYSNELLKNKSDKQLLELRGSANYHDMDDIYHYWMMSAVQSMRMGVTKQAVQCMVYALQSKDSKLTKAQIVAMVEAHAI